MICLVLLGKRMENTHKPNHNVEMGFWEGRGWNKKSHSQLSQQKTLTAGKGIIYIYVYVFMYMYMYVYRYVYVNTFQN